MSANFLQSYANSTGQWFPSFWTCNGNKLFYVYLQCTILCISVYIFKYVSVYICQGEGALWTTVYILAITNPGCGIAANHVFVSTAGSIVKHSGVLSTVNTLEQSLVCAVPYVVVSLNPIIFVNVLYLSPYA